MVMWTSGTTQLRCNLNSGGVWQGSYPAVTENSVDDASLAWDGQEVWAVYGRRDSDLHWNIWAATPDPEGVHGGTWSASGLGITLCGRNPSSGSFSLNIASGAENVELRIFDMSGRCLLDRTVQPGDFTWNSMEQSGDTVPPGIYFAVVSDGRQCDSCRMIKL
jgi:hypothetical protein